MEDSIAIKPGQAFDSINLIINFLQQRNCNLTEEISYAEKIKIKILNEIQISQVQKVLLIISIQNKCYLINLIIKSDGQFILYYNKL